MQDLQSENEQLKVELGQLSTQCREHVKSIQDQAEKHVNKLSDDLKQTNSSLGHLQQEHLHVQAALDNAKEKVTTLETKSNGLFKQNQNLTQHINQVEHARGEVQAKLESIDGNQFFLPDFFVFVFVFSLCIFFSVFSPKKVNCAKK
jgi:uncharacterized phage infection (PIP) family protein YhgE